MPADLDLDAIEAALCADSDPLTAMEAAPHLLAEIRTLRADLAAARADAANARSVAAEAIVLLDTRLNPRTLDGYVFKDEAEAQAATLRSRLASPADHAARVTAAVDRLVEAAGRFALEEECGSSPGEREAARVGRDAARAEVLAAIGVGRG